MKIGIYLVEIDTSGIKSYIGRMTDTQNTPPHDPDTHETDRFSPYTINNDVSARSLSKCMGAAMGDDHPAADLEKMRAQFLDLMMNENSGQCTMRREVQVLDTLFHSLINKAMDTPADHDEQMARLLVLALRTQKQASDTLKTALMMPYLDTVRESMANKPNQSLGDYIAKRETYYEKQYEKNHAK